MVQAFNKQSSWCLGYIVLLVMGMASQVLAQAPGGSLDKEEAVREIHQVWSPAWSRETAWTADLTATGHQQAAGGLTCLQGTVYEEWQNTSASAQGLSAVVAGRTILIGGIFQVDQPLLLNNCQVYLLPNARIQVHPGVHLQVRWSRLEACTDMWDGIYLDHPTARITVLNQSWNNAPYIKHALNGIVVSNGAQFTLTNANLLDNYRHLQVRDWTGSYANSVTGTVFGCLSTGIGRAPHVNDITVAAVTLLNGGSINLGGTALLPEGNINRNEIYRSLDGIFVDHASVEFNNWDIHDISRSGVRAERGGAGYFVNSNFLNVIERMQVGITVMGHLGVYNVHLTYNRVGDVTNTGIFVGNCNISNTILIEGNEVKQAARAGIWVSNSRESWVDIDQNQITAISSPLVNTGILVVDPFAPPTNATYGVSLYGNTVSNYFSGIFIQNKTSPTITFNTVAINSATSPTGKGSGLFARGCIGTTIYGNSTNTLSNAFLGSKIGIGVESSPHTQILDNVVRNTSDGIFISGNCFPTLCYCNELHGYWRGVVYNYALVGPQGNSSNPQGNKWYPTSGAFDTYSFFTSASQWPFYAQTMTLPLRPQNNGFAGLQAISPTWTGSSSLCGPTISPSIDPIANSNQGFETWPADQAENAHFWALKSLHRDNALLNLDPSYATYKDNWDATSLGMINAYLMAVEDGDASQAAALRAGLNGNSQTESNFLAAMAAYDDKYLSGAVDVDEAVMADIAGASIPQPSGAALLARWLLCDQSMNPDFFAVQDESEASAKADGPSRSQVPGTASLRVSPVPAKDVLQVTLTGAPRTAELIGLEGRVLSSRSVHAGSQSIQRDGLGAGIYYLKVTFEDGTTLVEKIIFQ